MIRKMSSAATVMGSARESAYHSVLPFSRTQSGCSSTFGSEIFTTAPSATARGRACADKLLRSTKRAPLTYPLYLSIPSNHAYTPHRYMQSWDTKIIHTHVCSARAALAYRAA